MKARTNLRLSHSFNLNKIVLRYSTKPSRKSFPCFAIDRLYRLARIFSIAQEILEGEGGAREWLQRP